MASNLWTKDYILLASLNFFANLIFYLDILLTTEFAINYLQVSASMAGLASGVFILGALIARVIVGRYLDLFGRKRMLFVGTTLYFLFSLLYHAVDSMSFLYFVRFFHGMFYGLVATAANTIVATIVPAARRGEGIGYFTVGVTLGTAIGPLVEVLLSHNGDYTNALYVCDVLAAVGILVSLAVKVPEVEVGFRLRTQMKSVKMKYFYEKAVLPIAAIAFFGGCSYSAVMSFIGAYAASMKLMLGGSLFFVFFALAALLARPAAGKLMDTKGNNIVMYPAMAILGAGYIAIALARVDWLLLLGACLVGGGFGALLSGGQTIAIRMVSLQRVSLATSTFYVFLDLGSGIGPSVLGLFVKEHGFSAVYFCSALLVFIALAVYYVLIGRNPKTAFA